MFLRKYGNCDMHASVISMMCSAMCAPNKNDVMCMLMHKNNP